MSHGRESLSTTRDFRLPADLEIWRHGTHRRRYHSDVSLRDISIRPAPHAVSPTASPVVAVGMHRRWRRRCHRMWCCPNDDVLLETGTLAVGRSGADDDEETIQRTAHPAHARSLHRELAETASPESEHEPLVCVALATVLERSKRNRNRAPTGSSTRHRLGKSRLAGDRTSTRSWARWVRADDH